VVRGGPTRGGAGPDSQRLTIRGLGPWGLRP